jgi:general nucleoside transport system permease protein
MSTSSVPLPPAARAPWRRLLTVYSVSLFLGLAVMLLITFKAFGLQVGSPDAWRSTISAAPDYWAILFVNALIGVSVVLLIVQLRWDALRVLLTVAVALVFGYLITAFFNLDASDRFVRGDFRVQVLSDTPALTDINYGDKLSATLNDPKADTPITEVTHTFTGRAGDVVSVLTFADDKKSDLDLQETLLDQDGNVLIESTEASSQQMRTFRRYLASDKDAVIENFTLPVDGFYTIVAGSEPASADVAGDFTVALLSDSPPPVSMAYNGEPVGGIFNKENDPNPLRKASYRFAGHEGDTISVLAYVFRSTIQADLQVKLIAPDGTEIGANNNATDEQVAQFPDELKSTRDAIIQNIVLPADGIYTVVTQPEPIGTWTKLRETIASTNNAYDAFLLGPLSRLNRWVIWIRDALTLTILGLAIAIVFRAEQFSLGAEGQLYFGALVSGVVGLYLSDLPRALLVPLALLSAATAGFLWGLLPGALKAYLGANELVSTLMLNTIATRFYEMVLTFQLQPPDAGYTSSEWIPKNGLLAPIIDINGDQVSIAVFILIFIVLLTWILIQRTPIGYEIRMIGANIKFADYGGVNTRRTIMLVMAISGAVAGLAGAHLAMGIHRKLILNISVGLAFEGVVVALLARNDPLVVPFTGLLYAYLRTGAQVMERDSNISAEIVRIIQAVVILLITAEALVTFLRRRRVRRRGTVDVDGAPPGGGLTQALPAKEGAHG